MNFEFMFYSRCCFARICNEYGILTFRFGVALLVHLLAAVLLSFADKKKVPACFAKDMSEGQKKHRFIE
jgi:hypothetical protein